MKGQKGSQVEIFDVISYWQGKFISACDSFFGKEWEGRDFLIKNKGLRGSFKLSDFREILRYNKREVELLEDLIIELRARLDKVGIRFTKWYGPGSIAAEMFKQNHVQDAMAICPENVNYAARCAFTAGRIEAIKWGAVYKRCYEYDLNSAYPYAMQFLPNLAAGTWKHRGKNIKPKFFKEFALYYVKLEPNGSYSEYSDYEPKPLFRRTKDSNVYYPMHVEGWFWAPEVCNAIEYAKKYNRKLTIIESFIFVEDNPDNKPFAFVKKIYEQRCYLKSIGDGAELGLKLGLNSMYGKMVQQVGGTLDHLPPFHQIEWGGYLTSLCRATVYQAVIDDLNCVIAFQTDAIFTTKRLNHLSLEEGLGNWKVDVFDDLTMQGAGVYFAGQNGKTYFGEEEEPVWINKTRGYDKGTVTREDVEEVMRTGIPFEGMHTQFYGLGLALHQDFSKWRKWVKKPRKVNRVAVSKRMHLTWECPDCRGSWWDPADPMSLYDPLAVIPINFWHVLVTHVGPKGLMDGPIYPNVSFKVAWIDEGHDSSYDKEVKETKEWREEQLYLEW